MSPQIILSPLTLAAMEHLRATLKAKQRRRRAKRAKRAQKRTPR